MTIFLRARAVFGCAVSKIMLLVKKNTYKYVFIAIVCASRNPTSPSRSSSSVTWWVVSVGRDKSREVPTCVGNVFRFRFSKGSRRFSKSSRKPKLSPEATKIESKRFQNRPQKPSKIEPQTFPNRAQMAPRGGQDGQKTEKEYRPKKIEVSICRRRPFLKEKVANMAPSCHPKSSKNPLTNRC